MTAVDLVVLGTYNLALGLLAVYGVHRFYLVRLRRRLEVSSAPPPQPPPDWPSVTVQLPVFNEPNVVQRLLDAVAAMRYPGQLVIQVLDDSTDETTALVEQWIERAGSECQIDHVRRTSRDGFKAGALAHGMLRSRTDLYAVFDADFVPPDDFLLRTAPHFSDTTVGMVQARWGHLNRNASVLTRVQSIYLDAHFAVESAARHLGGRFFNFNGTAGVWRREAIEEAGGWSASTLTEDLDLSYRAQLAGWKFVFRSDIEVPAELPVEISGFQQQQHRWAKGSIQTARKLIPSLLRSDCRTAVKAEALFHLTNNSAYLFTVVVALLLVPAIVIRQRLGLTSLLIVDALMFLASTISVLVFYADGQRWAGRGRIRALDLLAVLPFGVGISLRNAGAVAEGLFVSGGFFHRTPKRGGAGTATSERRPRIPWVELVLTLFFATAVVVFVMARQWVSTPFLLLFLSGYAHVAFYGCWERLTHSFSKA